MSALATANKPARFDSARTARLSSAELILRIFSGTKVSRSFDETARAFVGLMSESEGDTRERVNRVLCGTDHFSAKEIEHLRQIVVQRVDSEAGKEIIAGMRMDKTALLKHLSTFAEDGDFSVEMSPKEPSSAAKVNKPEEVKVPVRASNVGLRSSSRAQRPRPASVQSAPTQSATSPFVQYRKSSIPDSKPEPKLTQPAPSKAMSRGEAPHSKVLSSEALSQTSSTAPPAASVRHAADQVQKRQAFLRRWFAQRKIPINFDERSAAFVLGQDTGTSVELVLGWLNGASLERPSFLAFVKQESSKFPELELM